MQQNNKKKTLAERINSEAIDHNKIAKTLAKGGKEADWLKKTLSKIK